jgi:type I restriction enzyme, S subunit
MRLRHILVERDSRGHADEVVLSVYRDLGVIRKDSRADNFNKTPEDRSAYKLVLPGDVVVNKMKAWQGSIGVSDHRGIVSGDYLVCAVVGSVDHRYLHHLLRSAPIVAEYGARSVGIRPSQWRLYWDGLADISVAMPEQQDQRKVADFLDREIARIDALIAAKRRMILLGEERFQSGVFGAVTGLRVQGPRKPSGLNWAGTIPLAWSAAPVSANFDVQLGKMLNTEAATGPDQRPYLRNTDVQWDRINTTDLPTMHFDADDRLRCNIRPGDLMVCEGGEVGRAAIWDGTANGDYFFQKAIHRVRPRRSANPRFLMYCLRAAASLGVFRVEGNMSTIVHLTREQLLAHRFPWPPPQEQADIVSRLDRLNSEIGELTRLLRVQIDRLTERRQALITAAVTGQIKVPVVA